LDVRTSPNAQVYLDGAQAGRADSSGELILKNLRPGPHTLRVTLDAKRDFEQPITVTPAATGSVNATLTDVPGRAVITSEPGADVYLDNASKGKTDSSGKLVLADVAPGSHQLRVSGQGGRKDYSQNIEVTAGRENSITAYGEALPGKIRIQATPGAKVFIDDWKYPLVEQYNGELSNFEFPPGTHYVRVQEEGKPEFKGSVSVSAGQQVTFNAPRNTPPAPGKPLDRLYCLTASDNHWYCIQFFPDGAVLFRGNAPSLAEEQQRLRAGKSAGDAVPYQVQGSTIRWSSNMMDGHFCTAETDWKAVVRGNTLITETAYTCDGGKVTKENYKLVESHPAGAH
jgi:hypothetical protein